MGKDQKPQFEALKAKWYKKLQKSGFDDIENDYGELKTYSGSKLGDASNVLVKVQARQEYYRLAGHFLHDYKFESKLHRLIWELHSTGVAGKPIAKILRAKRFKTNYITVFQVINDLKAKMLKMYAWESAGTDDEDFLD